MVVGKGRNGGSMVVGAHSRQTRCQNTKRTKEMGKRSGRDLTSDFPMVHDSRNDETDAFLSPRWFSDCMRRLRQKRLRVNGETVARRPLLIRTEREKAVAAGRALLDGGGYNGSLGLGFNIQMRGKKRYGINPCLLPTLPIFPKLVPLNKIFLV